MDRRKERERLINSREIEIERKRDNKRKKERESKRD
jgi:hypothetical protein